MENTEKNRMTADEIISLSLRILLGIIIGVLVFVASVLLIDRLVNKSRIPSFFGKSLLVIATPSMSGSIEAGDAVIIQKQSSYAVGDVITYFPAGDTVSVTHRIIEVQGDKFFTKGDANKSKDPDPVFMSQIEGKTIKILPKLGIIIEWLRTGQGIAFLIAIGAVIIALVAVIDSYDNEEVEEKQQGADDNADNDNKDVSATTDNAHSEVIAEMAYNNVYEEVETTSTFDDVKDDVQYITDQEIDDKFDSDYEEADDTRYITEIKLEDIPQEVIESVGGDVEQAKRLWYKKLKRNRKRNSVLRLYGYRRKKVSSSQIADHSNKN